MFMKKRVIADADHFSLKWSPVLLRFFQLFVGNQSVAEALTIETLAEHIRTTGTKVDDQTVVLLLRRAAVNGIAAQPGPTCTEDPLVKALTQLAPMERAAVVLLRGLSLGVEQTSEILKVLPSETRRLFVVGLSELNRLLSRSEMNVSVPSPRINPIPNLKEWSK
jgi:hypothetical protein